MKEVIAIIAFGWRLLALVGFVLLCQQCTPAEGHLVIHVIPDKEEREQAIRDWKVEKWYLARGTTREEEIRRIRDCQYCLNIIESSGPYQFFMTGRERLDACNRLADKLVLKNLSRDYKRQYKEIYQKNLRSSIWGLLRWALDILRWK